MIKKLFYVIIPLIFITFSQNVKALDKSNLIVQTSSLTYSYINSHPEVYTQIGKATNGAFAYLYKDHSILTITTTWNTTRNIGLAGFSNASGNIQNILISNQNTSMRIYLSVGDGISIVNNKYAYTNSDTFVLTQYAPSSNAFSYTFYEAGTTITDFMMSNDRSIYYTSYDLYRNNNLYVSKNFDYIPYVNAPELSHSLQPIYKDGYISSYGIKVNSSIVDDTKFKYQYAIKDNIDDDLNWVDLYNNNFLNNQFAYITKKPIYFYFQVVDKSNNDVIDAFTITVSFDLASPEYDIIFNQDKFYVNGTNNINRIGLSVTYKTSVDGLKYQYQYVNDGSSLDDNNWVDTDSDIYKVYNVNGVMYARILDNDNNVLYSATFLNTLIGKQDILVNPNNFPLYNKVQSVLNFNKGSISDLVLIPVKVLMFMSDSLNNHSCNEYSFGFLLGHELKLPCIDIKSYVGDTIYNFYDLVCSFFISLGIIRLLKNIYMRFMTLDIRDIDRNGGIF